eukprot:4215330-Ditylum_brightwellii.AAC.1
MMTFVSPDEATTDSVVHISTLSDTSHLPTNASLAEKKVSQCMICDMEESVLWHVMKGDYTYYKTKIRHPMAVQLGNFARNLLPRLSARSNQCILPAIYQNSDNDTSALSDPHLGTDNESAVTAEIVT